MSTTILRKAAMKTKLYDDSIKIVDFTRLSNWVYRDVLCDATGIERNDLNLAIRYLKDLKLIEEKKKDGEQVIIYRGPK